jgi:hypothetical protein
MKFFIRKLSHNMVKLDASNGVLKIFSKDVSIQKIAKKNEAKK